MVLPSSIYFGKNGGILFFLVNDFYFMVYVTFSLCIIKSFDTYTIKGSSGFNHHLNQLWVNIYIYIHTHISLLLNMLSEKNLICNTCMFNSTSSNFQHMSKVYVYQKFLQEFQRNTKCHMKYAYYVIFSLYFHMYFKI